MSEVYQTTKMLALPGKQQETYCFWCQDHLHHIYKYIISSEHPPPHPLNLPAICEQDGGDIGSRAFFFFSPLLQALRGENEDLRRRRWTEISKWCLLFGFFSTHACPFQSSPSSPKSPFISITPAIMTLRRESEAALWCIFFPTFIFVSLIKLELLFV